MNRTTPTFLLAAMACLAPGMARGALLFERSVVIDRSANIFNTTEFDLKVMLSDTILAPNSLALFDLDLTPANAGGIFEANAAVLATFGDVAARLTDGRDEFISLIFSEKATGRAEFRGWFESGFFLGLKSGGPDLAGATIEAVQLRVDAFNLSSSGGSSTLTSAPPVDVVLTISVMGVPEPASLLLGAIGLALIGGAAYPGGRGSVSAANVR